jgi:hypothetical protein
MGTCSASGSPTSSSSERSPSASPMTYSSVTLVPAIAARAVATNAGMVTSMVAPESSSWWWTSPSV